MDDEEPDSPKPKKQRVEKDVEIIKNKQRFSLFAGIRGLNGNNQAQYLFPTNVMPSMGCNFAVGSNSIVGSNPGYGSFREKVGECVMIDMHTNGTMGMQRSMKESAEVSFFNRSAIVKHAYRPSSVPMIIQTVLFMIKERLKKLEQQDMSIELKAQICAGIIFDTDAAFQLVACGITWCSFETVGMVTSRALMLDQHNQDKTKSISTLLAEGGIYAAIQQAQSNSNTVYGSFKGPRKNKKKRRGICFALRDKGSCSYGSKCI